MSIVRLLGKPIYTADNLNSAPTVSQKITKSSDVLVDGFSIGVIQVGNPNYTSIQALVFADRAGSPGKLLYSSNAVTKAKICQGSDNSWGVFAFTFASPIPLNGGESYHIALFMNGIYTGADISHIAWQTGHPDPIYKTGVTIDQVNAAKMPLHISAIVTNA